jgi:hypothetical protein
MQVRAAASRAVKRQEPSSEVAWALIDPVSGVARNGTVHQPAMLTGMVERATRCFGNLAVKPVSVIADQGTRGLVGRPHGKSI